MRKITVVTTFPPDSYELYAKKMLSSFDENWPKDITLLCYYENIKPDISSNRIEYRNLEKSSRELVKFKIRHKNNPHAHGLSPSKKIKGYHWDAVKFAHKTFCVDIKPFDKIDYVVNI